MGTLRNLRIRGAFKHVLDEQCARLQSVCGVVNPYGDVCEAALVEFFKLPPEVQQDRIDSRVADLRTAVKQGQIVTAVDVGVVRVPKAAGGRNRKAADKAG